MYFDFFLFNPETKCKSELKVFETIINYGKERFLIHPVFEVFLEIKWYRTWLFYGMYVLAYMMFLMGLAGYALFHLGNIYDGGPKYDFKVSYVNGVLNY